jgi:hypothetical protein
MKKLVYMIVLITTLFILAPSFVKTVLAQTETFTDTATATNTATSTATNTATATRTATNTQTATATATGTPTVGPTVVPSGSTCITINGLVVDEYGNAHQPLFATFYGNATDKMVIVSGVPNFRIRVLWIDIYSFYQFSTMYLDDSEGNIVSHTFSFRGFLPPELHPSSSLYVGQTNFGKSLRFRATDINDTNSVGFRITYILL